jgi:hypothetical protein
MGSNSARLWSHRRLLSGRQAIAVVIVVVRIVENQVLLSGRINAGMEHVSGEQCRK